MSSSSGGLGPPSQAASAAAAALAAATGQGGPPGHLPSTGSGSSRAFAHKLPKAHALDIRRQTAAELKHDASLSQTGAGSAVAQQAHHRLAAQIGRSSVHFPPQIQVPGQQPQQQGLSHGHPLLEASSSYSSASLQSMSTTTTLSAAAGVEPLDYEEYVLQQHRLGAGSERDPRLAHLVEFPRDDIEVKVVPRKIRTLGHVLPEEPMEKLDPSVQNCVDCYTSDFVVVRRKYQHHSSSVRVRSEGGEDERLRIVETIPAQEFEVDDTPEASPEAERPSGAASGEPAPRGSWASFDLRNSQPDALIPGLLEHTDPEAVDGHNEVARANSETRVNRLFQLYPAQPEGDRVERRSPANEPSEPGGRHRIHVQCNKLELNIQVEPIFATVALYDAKEKKKISENFYFDVNQENIRRMLEGYIPHADYSTQARACVFDISYPSADLFLVVKLEKVLQGDISEAAEPYLKETQNLDKVRANASDACNRLGKYRMPFAWTAIWLQNIIKGKETSGDSGSDADSASNSLDRKSSTSSFEQFRRSATRGTEQSGFKRQGSLERRDKRSSWAGQSLPGYASAGGVGGANPNPAVDDGMSSMFESFPPVTLTVSSFFKQEGDKLRDDDLYKFLLDLKRPSTALKKLKCIRGELKLDISVAPERLKCCFTPELTKIIPFPDMKSRPVKEVLEFPPKELLTPNYQFRNLLYVCPKDLNFTNRSGERARNIAIKVQLMGEEDSQGLKVIFGKSSCPEFTTEAYTAVTYHNKTPDFYEEVKMKLPSNLRERHHLLFTFYHISCQGQRKEQVSTEIPVGYTWVPLFRGGSLQTGLFELPVMLDAPQAALRYIPADAAGAPPGTKWVDNRKPIFSVELSAFSSVHPIDPYLDGFLNLTATLQLGHNSAQSGQQAHVNERAMEDDLIKRLGQLHHGRLEPLVRFLPLVLDKLLLLMVKPPVVAGHVLNVTQAAFNAIASVVNKIWAAPELQGQNDRHGRNGLLTSYIHYQAHLPHPDFRQQQQQAHQSSSVGTSMLADDEVGHILMKGQQEHMAIVGRTVSDALNTTASSTTSTSSTSSLASAKLVHEQLALQWSISSGPSREEALCAGWFFLELMIKAMIEHLATTSRLGVHRKSRFSEQFHDDVINLVAAITSDIVCRQKQHPEMVQRLNSSLAFFLHDLLSVMDRGFVFSLIRTYMKDVSSRMTSNSSEFLPLWHLQLDFVRIVCSHEHYVALNLPALTISDLMTMSSTPIGAASPTPSIRSTDSQTSFITHPVPGEASAAAAAAQKAVHWAELTQDFRRKHFLVGLSLSLLSNALEQSAAEVHSKAVNAVRNLLTSHDVDVRYKDSESKARVASLYLPLVGILVDNLGKLYAWTSDGDVRIIWPDNAKKENLNLILTAISDNVPNSKGPIVLKEATTRNILICLLWVLKHVEKSVLKQWWSEMAIHRLQILLEILRITVSCFQYKGKKMIRKHATLGSRKSSDMRSRLEDMIMGSGSNRQELLMRNSRKDLKATVSGKRLPPSPNPETGRRWHKTSFLKNALPSAADSLSLSEGSLGGQSQGAGSAAVGGGSAVNDPETDAHIEGLLASEASMIVLDTLEIIVQVVSQSDQSTGLLASVLRVLLHALGTNQSTHFLQHLFAVQRSFVFKFPGLLFDEASEHCADLCLRLLKHCSSSISAVRSQASASLYLLMRQNFEIGNNFARVKMQVTMSLSKLVGTISNFNEEFLRKSLKTILVYAEQDDELSNTTFPEQVQDLVFNLHMILSDTVKMKEYIDDPEMYMDLMYRIAKGYQNSPDLRLTWLESMATKHEQYGHFAEAGMCKVHCASLISEYMHMLEDRKYMPTGAVTFSRLTPNALEESAVSDDVVSPDEEGICTGKNFTEQGLMNFLDNAARYFSQAGMFEAVNEVYKAGLPIAEASRDFIKLAEIHKDLHEAFKNINRLQGKRIFGTYFRVGFYGARFGDLDGEEYIYKEKALAKLPEIAQRLEGFYGDKFGKENVVIIKDSKIVEITKLNPEKAYIQITYVEPYFDSFELRDRLTAYEKNFNIIRFIFATPFTPDGAPHGELHEQYKRKTILTAANHFPYVKTRIQVVDRKQIVLTPIEVAIEDVQKKIQELDAATKQEPADPKILQMVLQGCIGTTVNQGPTEVANVFLKDLFDGTTMPTKHQNKLRTCFKDMANKCDRALQKNKQLITADQKEYQRELEKNYRRFVNHMSPLFNLSASQRGSPLRMAPDDGKVTSPMV